MNLIWTRIDDTEPYWEGRTAADMGSDDGPLFCIMTNESGWFTLDSPAFSGPDTTFQTLEEAQAAASKWLADWCRKNGLESREEYTGPQRAIITLTDEEDGRINVGLVFEPAATQETKSNACWAAMGCMKLLMRDDA